jgi:hypothetical protein
MKIRLLILAVLLTAGALLLMTASPAAAQDSGPVEPYSGESLCLPDAYLQPTTDCLPLGPSQTLTALARQGMTYPPRPLPASKPPAELAISPVQVARINAEGSQPVDIYATLDDAAAGTNATRQIAPGALRYVSYIQMSEVNGKPFVMLRSGEWVRASPSGYPNLQGLAFRQTPSTGFGWAIETIRPYTTAGDWNSQGGGSDIPRWGAIQVYETLEINGMEWYRIGPDQWLPWQKARQVKVDTTPPQGVTNDRWIEVNLYNQTIAVYQDRRLVFASIVSTGVEPFYTRPGLFQIYEKKQLETMQGAFEADRSDFYYLEDVPWTMYFDESRALHGAYWNPFFGWARTHGCVNLSIGDAAWLFQWANEGDWVYVWDPSGETPTDPSLYTAGGA